MEKASRGREHTMLHGEYLEKNRNWPRWRGDFDKSYPLPSLVLRSTDPRRAVWTTSWSNNLAGLLLAASGLGFVAVVWVMRGEIEQAIDGASTLVRMLVWGLAGVAALVELAFLSLIVFRGVLILDQDEGELQVRAWGRSIDRVPLSSIRLLSHENVWKVASGDHDADTRDTQPVLVMELHDGTLIRLTDGGARGMQQVRQMISAACSAGVAARGAASTAMPRDPAPASSESAASPCEILATSDRDRLVLARITAIGIECFPDNAGVEWKVRETEHRGRWSYVEAQPEPDEVGYQRFVLVLDWEVQEPPNVVGCYCWDRGGWDMLFGVDPGQRHAPRESLGRR